MELLDQSLIQLIIGISAAILALSIFVQILEELYKYLTSSSSRAYTRVLQDFLGSLGRRLSSAPEFGSFRVRGPFEWLRKYHTGRLLPLNKDDLGKALTKTLPLWVQRTLSHIELEKTVTGNVTPSRHWRDFLERLGAAERGSKGYWTARDIAEFLTSFGHSWNPGKETAGKVSVEGIVNFTLLDQAFRNRFLHHVNRALDSMPQLEQNLNFTLRRRHIRQTTVLAFIVVFLFGLPIQEIYQKAASIDAETSTAVAEKLVNLNEQLLRNDTSAVQNTAVVDSLLRVISLHLHQNVLADTVRQSEVNIPVLKSEHWKKYRGFTGIIHYLFGCLITTVLISFGAPFWNDILKTVLRYKDRLGVAGKPAAGGGNEK